jgi:cell division protein ZapA (FtsZ GTPase activity inhibitor)
MEENLITINVVIADRSFRIKVPKHQEEQVRNTCKTVNEKIIEYKTMFAAKDMQDLLSMSLLWVATNIATEDGNIENTTVLESTAVKLEKLVNKYS